MRQVHGDNIVVVDESSPETLPDCDAIVTNRRGIALVVMVADCIPLLLFDETKGVAAAVHAGRNGTFLNIAAKCAKTTQIYVSIWAPPSAHAVTKSRTRWQM